MSDDTNLNIRSVANGYVIEVLENTGSGMINVSGVGTQVIGPSTYVRKTYVATEDNLLETIKLALVSKKVGV